jgi:hypothetical protein
VGVSRQVVRATQSVAAVVIGGLLAAGVLLVAGALAAIYWPG